MSVASMTWETLRIDVDDGVCTIQLHRPENNNTINDRLVDECLAVLQEGSGQYKVVVLKGLPQVFCYGADFKAISQAPAGMAAMGEPRKLYELWSLLAGGPFVSIALVKGRANAGGIGFVAACDVVLADETAQFSLSELLFGVYPACVLPFLVRRVGVARANFMTLMTQPIGVQQAHAWGLVDAYEDNADLLLRKHVARLKRLEPVAVGQYKKYAGQLTQDALRAQGEVAVAANLQMFGQPHVRRNITRYVQQGLFPWE